MLSNLYQSMCRSDQDDWLRKMKLSRIGGSFAGASPNSRSLTNTLAASMSADGDDNEDPQPIRGYSNVAALIAAASPSKQEIEERNKGSFSSQLRKFDVGNQARISQALRLCGEDQTAEDETAMPKVFNVSSNRGAASKKGEMQGWFRELMEKVSPAVQEGEEEKSSLDLLPLEVAKAEYCDQEHFGLPNPDKEFDKALSKNAPLAASCGGLKFDEFAIIFARFDYD